MVIQRTLGIIPTPAIGTDAANKDYVDQHGGTTRASMILVADQEGVAKLGSDSLYTNFKSAAHDPFALELIKTNPSATRRYKGPGLQIEALGLYLIPTPTITHAWRLQQSTNGGRDWSNINPEVSFNVWRKTQEPPVVGNDADSVWRIVSGQAWPSNTNVALYMLWRFAEADA